MTTTPVTSSRVLHASESGSRFSNDGAAGLVRLILPPCAPDLEFELVIVEGQTFGAKVFDTATETIVYEQNGAASNAVNLEYNGIGSSLRLIGTGALKWVVTQPVSDNTWTE